MKSPVFPQSLKKRKTPNSSVPHCLQFARLVSRALLLRLRDATLLETVLEPPGQGLDVPATASAGGPTALSLGGPVVSAHVRGRVSAGSTRRLLEMVGALSTTAAQGVRLVVALAETCSTLAYNLLMAHMLARCTVVARTFTNHIT